MKKLTLGFVGLGVVGGAVAKAFAAAFPTVGYDLRNSPNKKEDLLTTDIVFLSLPTMTVNGAQDQNALQDTCKWLADNKFRGPVVVKSTVLPGTCDQLKQEYGLRIVHNPEFLTAKTPVEDFMAQPAVLLSGTFEDVDLVGNAYQVLIPLAKIVYAQDYKTTELAKYTHNLFLATKVGFLNEIYKVCVKVGANYESVIAVALTQEKLGDTHVRVPNIERETGNPVPRFGFGGVCFPKDIQALLTWAKSMGLELTQIDATNEANLKIRPETRC
jgi:nucleotide sugar dehydrogenase